MIGPRQSIRKTSLSGLSMKVVPVEENNRNGWSFPLRTGGWQDRTRAATCGDFCNEL